MEPKMDDSESGQDPQDGDADGSKSDLPGLDKVDKRLESQRKHLTKEARDICRRLTKSVRDFLRGLAL